MRTKSPYAASALTAAFPPPTNANLYIRHLLY
jgi:hypothetical protein